MTMKMLWAAGKIEDDEEEEDTHEARTDSVLISDIAVWDDDDDTAKEGELTVARGAVGGVINAFEIGVAEAVDTDANDVTLIALVGGEVKTLSFELTVEDEEDEDDAETEDTDWTADDDADFDAVCLSFLWLCFDGFRLAFALLFVEVVVALFVSDVWVVSAEGWRTPGMIELVSEREEEDESEDTDSDEDADAEDNVEEEEEAAEKSKSMESVHIRNDWSSEPVHTRLAKSELHAHVSTRPSWPTNVHKHLLSVCELSHEDIDTGDGEEEEDERGSEDDVVAVVVVVAESDNEDEEDDADAEMRGKATCQIFAVPSAEAVNRRHGWWGLQTRPFTWLLWPFNMRHACRVLDVDAVVDKSEFDVGDDDVDVDEDDDEDDDAVDVEEANVEEDDVDEDGVGEEETWDGRGGHS